MLGLTPALGELESVDGAAPPFANSRTLVTEADSPVVSI